MKAETQGTTRADRNAALVEVMLLAAMADGKLTEGAIQTLLRRVLERPEFDGTKPEEISALLEKSVKRLASQSSLESILQRLRDRREAREAVRDRAHVADQHVARRIVARRADDLRQVDDDRAFGRDEHVVLGQVAMDEPETQHALHLLHQEIVIFARLCRLERTAAVQHLVSTVTGRLAPGRDAFDLLAASFPGGSITGAPKIRAMEILEELEPVRRGPYTGALGWIGPDGAMGTSILIRTFTAGRGWLQFPVGGGIVADSDPGQEYEETLHKAAGLLRALAP